MPKKLTHYKDTRTGRYVSKAKWQRARKRGDARYKRTYERYVKPTGPRAPRVPKGDVLGVGGVLIPEVGRAVIRYEYKNKRGRVTQFEVEYVNGQPRTIRLGPRTYKQKASIHNLTRLINAATAVGRGRARSLRRK